MEKIIRLLVPTALQQILSNASFVDTSASELRGTGILILNDYKWQIVHVLEYKEPDKLSNFVK